MSLTAPRFDTVSTRRTVLDTLCTWPVPIPRTLVLSLEGVSKEGESQFPLFVPLGVWGESKRPSAFLPGCGAGSFLEKNAPHVLGMGMPPVEQRE